MPLLLQHTTPLFSWAVWKIDEPAAYFADLSPPANITNSNKALQWLASRHLAKQLAGRSVQILHNESGQPHLDGSNQQISITHTSRFAAVMLSDALPVGIDMEAINPKVLRIADKFLHPEEKASIDSRFTVEQSIIYWSAKESLYKLYGKKQLEFKTQLRIEPFAWKAEGVLQSQIITSDGISRHDVHYTVIDDHVLTYVLGR